MKRVLVHFLEKNGHELEIFFYYVNLLIKTNFFIGFFLQYILTAGGMGVLKSCETLEKKSKVL